MSGGYASSYNRPMQNVEYSQDFDKVFCPVTIIQAIRRGYLLLKQYRLAH